MKNTMVLEMINNGEIEQLKKLLTEEIYQDSLKGNGSAKSRYAAMKRYFKYSNNLKEMCNYPCKDIEINGKFYNSFLDGVCFVLTTESIDTLEVYDKTKGEYFDMKKLVDFSIAKSVVEEIDLNIVLAEAKSKGYKYKKSEIIDMNFQYAFKYKDSYYKVGILDKAFSIINDNNPAEVYYNGKLSLLLIKTSIGIAGVLPFKPIDNVEEVKTIIYVEN